MRRVDGKHISQIQREWDAIAELRHRQITSGTDLSYELVIVPAILRLAQACDFSSVIDIGCGSGVLEKLIARRCGRLVGVDISSKSIQIAKQYCKELSNVEFLCERLEDIAGNVAWGAFSLAIANMTLMTSTNLRSAVRATATLLTGGGVFVAAITHPCFWPRYWEYESCEWFDYAQEIAIEAPFRISREQCEFTTTHIHRPLSMYLGCLAECGFEINEMVEPIPSREVQERYPSPWQYPRFLGFRCTRKASTP